MRKIRELGSLPADAFEKYMNLTLSQVSLALSQCYSSCWTCVCSMVERLIKATPETLSNKDRSHFVLSV